jgi:hypothetical protein
MVCDLSEWLEMFPAEAPSTPQAGNSSSEVADSLCGNERARESCPSVPIVEANLARLLQPRPGTVPCLRLRRDACAARLTGRPLHSWVL